MISVALLNKIAVYGVFAFIGLAVLGLIPLAN